MSKLKINLNFSLKRLSLVTKGLVNTKFLGNYASAFKGSGLEFADYRRYDPSGDDAGLIDWKASMRVNDLIVKEYVEERNLDVLFVVDVSEKMLAGSVSKLKAEYIAELVTSLSYNMLSAGDAVGLVMFSDKIVKYVRPESGLKQVYSITENLSNTNNYGSYSDVDKATDFVFKHANNGSLIFLISDFIYPINSEKNFRMVAKKFDLIGVMVRDPIDMELPAGKGEVIVQDPVSKEVLLINPSKIRKEYKSMNTSDVNKMHNMMRKFGADLLFLNTGKSFVEPLIGFFKRRESEWS
jgi:uncharacterized protein (DUF58 family)